MALNTITPSNREEEYLSAIAGDEGASAPVPSNRREEWLRRIAEGQGEQTERLDHIAEQIPLDPAAGDVGKVLTVVEDTSGETPVYKWGAEEAASGGLTPTYYHHFSLSSTSSSIEVPAADVPNADAIRADMFAATSNPDLVARFLKHFRILVNGVTATPQIVTNFPVRNIIPVVVRLNRVVTIDGAEKNVEFLVNFNINSTGNNLLSTNQTTFKNPIGGSSITKNTITALQGVEGYAAIG